MRKQCELLQLSRSRLYYQPVGESAENLRFMEIIDKQLLETPWYGARQPLGTLLCNALPVIDGKGAWRPSHRFAAQNDCRAMDNRMIERLWRSLKYECVYLHAFETGSQARAGIGKWLGYYNAERPHSTHGILTPDEAYDRKAEPRKSAA